MTKPNFFTADGDISPDGQKVVDYLETQAVEASVDVAALNELPGYVKHYHLNVMRFHEGTGGSMGMAPAEWLKAFENSGAMNAWRALREVEAQQEQSEQVQETAEQTNVLAEQLEALRAEMDTLREELQEAREEKVAEPAKPKRKPRKAKVTEAEVEAEEPVDESTDETEDKPEDAPEEA